MPRRSHLVEFHREEPLEVEGDPEVQRRLGHRAGT